MTFAFRPPTFVQKEEGLREEHGSARQIARGPRCGAANGVSAETPAIERGVRDVVTYADMFTYTLVLIGLASLVITAFRHKK